MKGLGHPSQHNWRDPVEERDYIDTSLVQAQVARRNIN
jgi:hypothetical protein